MKRKQQHESIIRKAVKDFLKYDEWFVFTNYQSALSYPGVADLTATKEGVTVWVEIKTETGKQSQNQIDFERDIKNAGGNYVVVRNIDDIYNYLKSIGMTSALIIL